MPFMSGQPKFLLANNPILLPHQVKILREFFTSPFGKDFFLTGGTALSAFYLAHRDSKDFDLFTKDDLDLISLENTLQEITKKLAAGLEVKVRTQNYCEMYLENKKDGWIQRLDFVHEIPVHFGKFLKVENVVIDSVENIASNKIGAIFGRIEPKDYVDLYFILKETKTDFWKVFAQAQKKDLGVNEFYLGNLITAAQNMANFPIIKRPFDKTAFRQFYANLSRELLLKIKPS